MGQINFFSCDMAEINFFSYEGNDFEEDAAEWLNANTPEEITIDFVTIFFDGIIGVSGKILQDGGQQERIYSTPRLIPLGIIARDLVVTWKQPLRWKTYKYYK